MRTISLFARVPLLLAAVAASHLPATCVHAAAATNTGPTEVAGISDETEIGQPFGRAVAFYYPWYGNPATDGHYANWNHPVAVRTEPPRSYPGGDDIGSNFYPSRGCYSVNDPEVLGEHMRQLRQAGVGVLCASWWGKDTFTDRALPGLFKAAEEAGLLINFHIEPFPGRNATSYASRPSPIWSTDSARRRPVTAFATMKTNPSSSSTILT